MAEWGAQHIGLRIYQMYHLFFGKVSVCGCICFFAWKLKSYLNLYLSSSGVVKEQFRIVNIFMYCVCVSIHLQRLKKAIGERKQDEE